MMEKRPATAARALRQFLDHPPLTMPVFNLAIWSQLLSAAFLLAVVGFVESVSVAHALAIRRRQKIDPNQELVGLGMANISAALTGGCPVSGSFSRSVVNFSAGANTQLASIKVLKDPA